jgi:hypothetical protein
MFKHRRLKFERRNQLFLLNWSSILCIEKVAEAAKDTKSDNGTSNSNTDDGT